MRNALLKILAFCVLYFLPLSAALWSWLRWANNGREPLVPKWRRVSSFASVILASASLLAAAVSVTRAHLISGFRFYDPLLLAYMQAGFWLAFLAFPISLFGARRTRLPSALFSLVMLAFWLAAAAGE